MIASPAPGAMRPCVASASSFCAAGETSRRLPSAPIRKTASSAASSSAGVPASGRARTDTPCATYRMIAVSSPRSAVENVRADFGR